MEFSRSHPILIPRVLVAFGRVTENEKRELCSVPFKVGIVFVVVLTELHLKHSNSYRSINSKLQHSLSNPLGIWTLKITSFILPPRPPTRLKLCSNAPPKCRIDRQFFCWKAKLAIVTFWTSISEPSAHESELWIFKHLLVKRWNIIPVERRHSSGSNFLPQRTTFKFLAPRARTPVKCPWVGRGMLKLQTDLCMGFKGNLWGGDFEF